MDLAASASEVYRRFKTRRIRKFLRALGYIALGLTVFVAIMALIIWQGEFKWDKLAHKLIDWLAGEINRQAAQKMLPSELDAVITVAGLFLGSWGIGYVLLTVWRYWRYPADQGAFLEAVSRFDASETKRLLKHALRTEQSDLLTNFESARGGGVPLTVAKIEKYAEYYVKETDADAIKMTMLYTPKQVYDDLELQSAVDNITGKMLERKQILTRVCIGDPSDFDQSAVPTELEWFQKLHRLPGGAGTNGTRVLWVKKDEARAIAKTTLKHRMNAMDVLVLGDHVVFALKTTETGQVFHENGSDGRKLLHLFILETEADVALYKDFFRMLEEKAKPIFL
jgi:hypothetical protein